MKRLKQEKEIQEKSEAFILEAKSKFDVYVENLVNDVKNTSVTIRENIKELRNMK